MKKTQLARVLAYVTGMVNQQLLLQNEYLLAENRILRAHLPARLLLTDPERVTLAVFGKRLGRQGLDLVASVAKPETILAWFRKVVARKFDGSRHHRLYPGRPPIAPELTELIVRLARENSDWGYDRIAGALDNLGHHVSDQTVGNVLRRFGISPAPKRRQQMSWADFIRSHRAVLAGIDFFTVEVLTWRGWQRILCCSFCTWRHVASLCLELHKIRPRNGWRKWLVGSSMQSTALASDPLCPA
jgi:putative transposase